VFQLGQHKTAPGLVAAAQALGRPTYLPQDVGESAASLTATPAVHQGGPAFGVLLKQILQMPRDIDGHQSGTHFSCFKGRDLLVQSADPCTFFVIQDRAVDCTWNVVVREFGGRTGVDDGVETTQSVQRGKGMINVHCCF